MENFNININDNIISDIDKSISKENYVSKVIGLLKIILQNNFPNNYIKQEIKPCKDRINFACPYCGDSMQNFHRKRGNIILEGKHNNFFKCFNCGAFKRVDFFFKDHKIDLELDVVDYISNNLGDFSSFSQNNNKYDISLLLDVRNIDKYVIERETIKQKFGLIEAKDSIIWSWLTNRLHFQSEKFLYNPSKKYILILNITPSGKILGTQKRMFYGSNKYITINASKLHELMGLEPVPEEINVISQLFGIFQINFNKPITLFEGPLDSFLFKNSVANCGLHKEFPLDLNIRYFFDDDNDGRKKSIKLINEGNSVFLWDKFKKYLELPFRKKWDLNDVLIYMKRNNISTPIFDNYFSNDSLDLIDL